jgi:ABC-2 type transport system permease protein
MFEIHNQKPNLMRRAVMSAVFSVGQACFGMLMGLTFPKLDMVNEAVVIKQSLSSLLSMFIPMAALAVSAGAYAIGGVWAALAVVLVLTGICIGILHRKGPTMLRKIL